MILGILAVSLILRAIYISFPSMPWWDASIYIGMGKMIYTHGAIGMWEVIRPVVWPVILGGFWKIGIDPTFAGNCIQIASVIGTLYVIYKIGERLMPRAGLYASTLLSFTAVYFFFTNVPITDIPSAFLILVALWYILNNRYYLGGLFVGIAFTLRFPQGIFLIVIALAVIILNRTNIKKTLIQGIHVGLGFATLAVPYLIFNKIAYNSFLEPLKAGNTVFLNSPGQSSALFYYPWNLFLQNPFFVAGLITFFYWIYTYRTTLTDRARMLIIMSILIVGGYFMVLTHKELRYSIAFLPYIALLSGYGLSAITQRFSRKSNNLIITGIGIVLITGGLYFAVPSWANYSQIPELNQYYEFFDNHPGANVMAATPQILTSANIRLVEVMGTWENVIEAVPRRNDGSVDYIGINSCQMYCAPGSPCKEREAEAISILSKLKTEFSSQAHGCVFRIYSYIK